MLEFTARSDDLSDLTSWLRGLHLDDIDLAPLAPEVARVLDDENRRARLAGTDIHGSYLIEVVDVIDPRRGGNGPPLAPRYEASRVVANHFVRVVESGPNRLVVQAGWSGIPFLAAHAAGAGRLPVRDIIGLDPEADQLLSDVLAEYVRLRVEEKLAGRSLEVQFRNTMGI
jgi:hypothetical protein